MIMSEEIIEREAKRIIDDLTGDGGMAFLYGEIFDPTNINHLIVASYALAEKKILEMHMEEFWKNLNG